VLNTDLDRLKQPLLDVMGTELGYAVANDLAAETVLQLILA
jgi:hypothetical protein